MTERISLLVVGGGPAGLAAARAYRAAGGGGQVAIVTDEYRAPYERPPLTKELLRGEVGEEGLALEDIHWFTEQDVGLIGGRAVALSARDRVVGLSGGRELPYEQCVLATGAEPTRLPVPGSDDERVRVLRTLDHLRELRRWLGTDARVVVIGSGFIGCEIAASLRARGHAVSLISDEPAPNAARLGVDAAAIIRDWLTADGVQLHLDTPVDQIDRDGDGLAVRAGSESVRADLVVMATGVSPRSELAAQAGLDLDAGAVRVTAAMETDHEGVLAAGDVCRADNAAAGRPLRVEHWGDALAQGEIAGRTAAGAGGAWSQVPGFWSTIGRRVLKYAAWGDGYDDTHIDRRGDGSFTGWYARDGRLVGVLTHDSDSDYDQGTERIAEGAPWR